MEVTCNSDEKCHSIRFTYITLPRFYLVCFAAVFLKLRSQSSLPRCYKFSPAMDARWEHAAKTRFCRNLMGPYFQAVLRGLKDFCYTSRGFIKFLCRRSVGFFSRAFLVFVMKES